jgi:group I intron endonuclease
MSEDLEFILYKVDCAVSGKSYIGQTCSSLEHRWSQHRSNARKSNARGCAVLQAAIRKYGEAALTVTALATCHTQDQANAIEVHLIAQHGTQVPGGYNIEAGGGAAPRSAATRAKISAAHTGSKKPWLCGPRDPAVAAKIHAVRTANGSWGRKPGFKHTAKTRAKMKATQNARIVRATPEQMATLRASAANARSKNTGIVSDVTRAQISASMKKLFAERRVGAI